MEAAAKFGQMFLSYNFHWLHHIVDDFEVYGNLDAISAFKFESYLGRHIKEPVQVWKQDY